MIKLTAYFNEDVDIQVAAMLQFAIKLELEKVGYFETPASNLVTKPKRKPKTPEAYSADDSNDPPTTTDLILKGTKKGSVIMSKDVRTKFKLYGFSTISTGSALARLIRQGKLKKGKSKGEYIVR